MKENANNIIDDSLKIGNGVVMIDGKSLLKETEEINKLETGLQRTIGKTKDGMTLKNAARDCRKFDMVFPKPFTHKL